MDVIFWDYDFIMMFVVLIIVWKLGDKLVDLVEMYLVDIFMVQANMVGILVICIFVGLDDVGLFIGMQLMGLKFVEIVLLSLASILIC